MINILDKHILVTGALGFCGRHLCTALLEGGASSIVGTRFGSEETSFLDSRIRVVDLNITQQSSVRDVFQKEKPDIVVHLAAQSNARESFEKQELTFDVNVEGTKNILEGICESAPGAKLLYISSSYVYGETLKSGKIVTEESATIPNDPYSKSKLAAEKLCIEYQKNKSLDLVIARPFNHSGKGQQTSFVLSDWAKQVAEIEANKREANIFVGNLEIERIFMHVDDVVNAYMLLIKRGVPGEIYNIASNAPLKLKSLLVYLLKKTKKKINICVDEKKVRSGEAKQICASAEKLKALGWVENKSAFQALDDLYEEWLAELRL